MAKGVYCHESGINSSNYKHGNSKSRLYKIWVNMKTRCYNPKATGFNKWGGKGITVCNEWLHDFKAFYDWAMNNGYNDNLTIDRINNDKGYAPSNCRWATYSQQNKNKTKNTIYEYKGVKFNQCDVYKLFGIKRTTFQMRIKRGWSVEKAISRGCVS